MVTDFLLLFNFRLLYKVLSQVISICVPIHGLHPSKYASVFFCFWRVLRFVGLYPLPYFLVALTQFSWCLAVSTGQHQEFFSFIWIFVIFQMRGMEGTPLQFQFHERKNSRKGSGKNINVMLNYKYFCLIPVLPEEGNVLSTKFCLKKEAAALKCKALWDTVVRKVYKPCRTQIAQSSVHQSVL